MFVARRTPRDLSPDGVGAYHDLGQGVSHELERLMDFFIKNGSALDNIPPDITVGEIREMAKEAMFSMSPLSDGGEHYQKLLQGASGLPEDEGHDPQDIQEESETLPDLRDSPIENLLNMVHQEPYWSQGNYLVNLFNVRAELTPEHIYIGYDPDEEEITVCDRKLNVLLPVLGEDIFQVLKENLNPAYFSQNRPTLGKPPKVSNLHGYVDIEKSIALLKLPGDKEFLRKYSEIPKSQKVETLYDSFYNRLPYESYFSHRIDGGTIYLLFMGVDVVSYKIANLSWPHLRVKRIKKFRNPLDGDPSDIARKFRYRNRAPIRDKNLGSCYFAPLLMQSSSNKLDFVECTHLIIDKMRNSES